MEAAQTLRLLDPDGEVGPIELRRFIPHPEDER